jgi:hypothetical protein
VDRFHESMDQQDQAGLRSTMDRSAYPFTIFYSLPLNSISTAKNRSGEWAMALGGTAGLSDCYGSVVTRVKPEQHFQGPELTVRGRGWGEAVDEAIFEAGEARAGLRRARDREGRRWMMELNGKEHGARRSQSGGRDGSSAECWCSRGLYIGQRRGGGGGGPAR